MGRRRGINAAQRLTGGDGSNRFRRCKGLDRGRGARGVSWGSGGAIALLGRGSGATGRRGRGGAEERCGAELCGGDVAVQWWWRGSVWRRGCQGRV